jgi:hypothetical protein
MRGAVKEALALPGSLHPGTHGVQEKLAVSFPYPHPKFQTDVQSDSSSPWLGETKEIKNGTLETLLSGELEYTEGMKGRYRKDFRRCR